MYMYVELNMDILGMVWYCSHKQKITSYHVRGLWSFMALDLRR